MSGFSAPTEAMLLPCNDCLWTLRISGIVVRPSREGRGSAGIGQIDDYLGSAADPFFALLEEHRGFGPD